MENPKHHSWVDMYIEWRKEKEKKNLSRELHGMNVFLLPQSSFAFSLHDELFMVWLPHGFPCSTKPKDIL